uniref:Uncharacterized protein n=1 Tax=Oryza brachyantha TaxID=4533 RepID=J3MDE7_ORYBR
MARSAPFPWPVVLKLNECLTKCVQGSLCLYNGSVWFSLSQFSQQHCRWEEWWAPASILFLYTTSCQETAGCRCLNSGSPLSHQPVAV